MTQNLSKNAGKPDKAKKPEPKPRNRWKRTVFWIVGLVVLGGLGTAIFLGIRSRIQAETNLAQQTNDDAIPVVSVVHPKPTDDTTELTLPGDTQAFISTPIFARTSGYMKRWYTDIGAKVKKDQLLAEIETPELDQQLDQGRADLTNAQANLQISQVTNKRYQDLIASNSVSHQETDSAAADFHSKNALVQSANANVRRLEQLQSYEKIFAPFDGVVTARNVDVGSLIQTTDTRELFHLASIDQLRVYVAVPETYAAQVTNGNKVVLTADSFPGEKFSGTVVRNADTISVTSRTLNVEVDVDNSNEKLLPGAYVFAHFKIPSTPNSVTVPSNALLFRSEGPRLGVVRDGRVRLVPISIGRDYGTTLEVLSGVTTSDQVILDPSDSLAEDAEVKISSSNKKAP